MFSSNSNTAGKTSTPDDSTATQHDGPRPLTQALQEPIQTHAHDHLQPPGPTRFQTLMAVGKRFMAFVGPGYSKLHSEVPCTASRPPPLAEQAPLPVDEVRDVFIVTGVLNDARVHPSGKTLSIAAQIHSSRPPPPPSTLSCELLSSFFHFIFVSVAKWSSLRRRHPIDGVQSRDSLSPTLITPLSVILLVVSVGYMDPGNWATDLAGGSSFGYMLLFIIFLSNLMAVVLQGLAVKLGVVSGLGKRQLLPK